MTKQELANYREELKQFFNDFTFDAKVEAIMSWIGESTDPDVSHQLTILLMIWEDAQAKGQSDPLVGVLTSRMLSLRMKEHMHFIDAYTQGHASIKAYDYERQEVTLSLSLSHGAIDPDSTDLSPVFNLRVIKPASFESGLGYVEIWSITRNGIARMSSTGGQESIN